MCKVGDSSPWGTIDHVDPVAEGIVFVSTPSHGGMKLSREMQQRMPEGARCDGGWYEEDCEQCLVVVAMPDLFAPDKVEVARKMVKEYFPDEFTLITGEGVTLEESHTLRRRKFEKDKIDRLIVFSAQTKSEWMPGIPDGMVLCHAARGGRVGNRLPANPVTFLVPVDEYQKRGEFGFEIDPSRHQEVQENDMEAAPCVPAP